MHVNLFRDSLRNSRVVISSGRLSKHQFKKQQQQKTTVYAGSGMCPVTHTLCGLLWFIQLPCFPNPRRR